MLVHDFPACTSNGRHDDQLFLDEMSVGPYHFLLLSMSLFGIMDERFSCALSCLIFTEARFYPLEFSLYHGIANVLEGRKRKISASCCLVLQLVYQARGS